MWQEDFDLIVKLLIDTVIVIKILQIVHFLETKFQFKYDRQIQDLHHQFEPFSCLPFRRYEWLL